MKEMNQKYDYNRNFHKSNYFYDLTTNINKWYHRICEKKT